MHSFSYAAGHSRGSFLANSTSQLGASLGRSWQFYNFVGGAGTGTVLPTTVRNPVSAFWVPTCSENQGSVGHPIVHQNGGSFPKLSPGC